MYQFLFRNYITISKPSLGAIRHLQHRSAEQRHGWLPSSRPAATEIGVSPANMVV